MSTITRTPTVQGRYVTNPSGYRYIAAVCPHCRKTHLNAESMRKSPYGEGRSYEQCHQASPDWDAGSYFVEIGGTE